jgi:hypothetical protein
MPQLHKLIEFRKMLDPIFSPDTAVPGSKTDPPSSGHCAAVALVTQACFGGQLVSAMVKGQSHWFNRIDGVDVDLTGDQFGRPPVQMGTDLYPKTRVREKHEVRRETMVRAFKLAAKAGI